MDGSEPLYKCRGTNIGPLQEQQVLLTSEPTLQLPKEEILKFFSIGKESVPEVHILKQGQDTQRLLLMFNGTCKTQAVQPRKLKTCSEDQNNPMQVHTDGDSKYVYSWIKDGQKHLIARAVIPEDKDVT